MVSPLHLAAIVTVGRRKRPCPHGSKRKACAVCRRNALGFSLWPALKRWWQGLWSSSGSQ